MSNKNIQPFYKFRAEAGDDPTGAELLIFDVIGDWEDFGEVSAKAFAADLAALPKSVKRLDIHINSPGGSVSEANAIYSRLADHPSNKIIYVDGISASAATLIQMVGHKIYMRANATMMIHLPMAIGVGNADDMRTVAAALDVHGEAMMNLYAKRTGMERDKLRDYMAKESWFTAQQAVDHGFADEVRGVVKAAAVVGAKRVMFNGCTFDLSRFNNVPAFTGQTTEENPTMSQPVAEQPPASQPKPGEQQQPKPGEQAPPAAPPAPPAAPPAPAPAPPAQQPAAATANYDDGVKAERARVAALNAYDRPATHDLIVKAIADGKTVQDIMPELFSALEKKGQVQARRTDAQHLEQVPPSDAGVTGEDGDDFGARLKSAVQARLGSRGQKQRSVLHSAN
jgi:ATP-dependent protease ClpP protease subunit